MSFTKATRNIAQKPIVAILCSLGWMIGNAIIELGTMGKMEMITIRNNRG